MATRLPASQRTREELAALIEGHLSTASAKDELVKLATRLIVEEAFEGEAGDTIGQKGRAVPISAAGVTSFRTTRSSNFRATESPMDLRTLWRRKQSRRGSICALSGRGRPRATASSRYAPHRSSSSPPRKRSERKAKS